MQNKLISKIFKVSLLVGSMTIYAEVPPDKKLQIDNAIQAELESALGELYDPKEIGMMLGFELPVKPPANPKDIVEEIVGKELDRQAKERYPKAWMYERLDKQLADYKQWKPGDKVTVEYTNGKTFTDVLRSNSPEYITLGPKRINKKDLTEATKLHLNPAKARQVYRSTGAKLEKEMLALRAQYRDEISLGVTRQIYSKQGYIRINNVWYSKKDYYEKRVKLTRKRLEGYLLPVLTYKHFYQAGYREFKGEWFTPEEANRLRNIDRIESELQPARFIAEMDTLNSEFLIGNAAPAAPAPKQQGDSESEPEQG
ncbi:MAG: hypothetical protein MK193_00150 [Lentisphaeria bacterium]|nr:hypothetical protein [Lentisphaeria bacterium]